MNHRMRVTTIALVATLVASRTGSREPAPAKPVGATSTR